MQLRVCDDRSHASEGLMEKASYQLTVEFLDQKPKVTDLCRTHFLEKMDALMETNGMGNLNSYILKRIINP